MQTQTKATRQPKFIPPAVERARQWVDGNWQTNPSLRDVAAQARISVFYFHRLFKLHTGKTVKNYVDDLRITEAKRLLSEGRDIGEVGTALGFAHQSHFTVRFRQHVGLPPAKWIKSLREARTSKAA